MEELRSLFKDNGEDRSVQISKAKLEVPAQKTECMDADLERKVRGMLKLNTSKGQDSVIDIEKFQDASVLTEMIKTLEVNENGTNNPLLPRTDPKCDYFESILERQGNQMAL